MRLLRVVTAALLLAALAAPSASAARWHEFKRKAYWGNGEPVMVSWFVLPPTETTVHVLLGKLEILPDVWTSLYPSRLRCPRPAKTRVHVQRLPDKTRVSVTLINGSACGNAVAIVPVRGYSPLYFTPVTIALWY